MDRVDNRRHAETMARLPLAEPAKKAVAPIGPSCEQCVLPVGDAETIIDVPMADVIRSKGNLEVGGYGRYADSR